MWFTSVSFGGRAPTVGAGQDRDEPLGGGQAPAVADQLLAAIAEQPHDEALRPILDQVVAGDLRHHPALLTRVRRRRAPRGAVVAAAARGQERGDHDHQPDGSQHRSSHHMLLTYSSRVAGQ
ncbi:MAG: hypothetical protein ACRD29_15740 [Acidimicrobiales bacterium]